MTWNYDPYRGWLTNKAYADGHGPNYSCTAAGRLSTRIWARGVATTYSYNNAGDLSGVDYSDTTPDVVYTFDRQGRQKTIVQNSITTTFSYNDVGEVLTESYSGGVLDSLSVTNGYDQFMRRTNLAALYFTTPLLTNSYSYDAASRLQTVRDGGTNSATYTYVANSPLVSQILFTNGTVQRMVATKSYDLLNRLTNIVFATNGTAVASFVYQYNSANQRTRRTDVDSSYWVYTYDSLGQLTSGKKYWSDGMPVAGQQFTYSFDDNGNRKTTGIGGDQTGGPLRMANYSANNLNEYNSCDVPGFVSIIGSAKTNATVSLWTPDGWWAQTIRHSDYFRGELAVNNSTGALWLTITNLAVLGNEASSDIVTNTIGNLFVPKTQEVFGYDADGNMTNDGRWSYTWDAENRLVQAESLGSGPLASKRKVVWQFDSKGRRVRQTAFDGSSGAYVAVEDIKLLSDGWQNVADLNTTNNALIRSYVWGLDLSGGMTGVSGVGGLLMLKDQSTINNQLSTHFLSYDGNGNVIALTSASDGTTSGLYEQGPFGETLRASGLISKANPFRFSTKRCENFTDLVLYERRAYRQSFGSWLSRDPIEDENPYRFVDNNPISKFDIAGLQPSAEDIIWQTLDRAGREISKPDLLPGDAVMTTGFPRVLSDYGDLSFWIHAQLKDPGKDKNALWDPNEHYMMIKDSSVQPHTIVHEMTHAWQDLILGYPPGDWFHPRPERLDEGEAFAMEGLYKAATELAAFKKGFGQSRCDAKIVGGLWKAFWRAWGVLPGAWPNIQWRKQASPAGDPMDRNDISRLYRVYQVRLSCRDLAGIVNQILGENHCNCMSVKCTEPADVWPEIGPGVQIDSLFQ